MGKHHDCERAGLLVPTEIEKVNAFGAAFDAQNFSGNALDFADVLAGFLNRDAVGGEEESGS